MSNVSNDGHVAESGNTSTSRNVLADFRPYPIVYVAGPYTMGWRDDPLAVERNKARGWEAVEAIWSACRFEVALIAPWADAELVRLGEVFGNCAPCEAFQRASLSHLRRCDGAIFTGDWTRSDGCIVERDACDMWRIPRFDASAGYAYGHDIAAFVRGLAR